MRRPTRWAAGRGGALVITVAAGLVLAGCGGTSPTAGGPAAAGSTVVASASAFRCPDVAPSAPAWPAVLPADFPRPPTATGLTEKTTGSITVLTFATPVALQSNLLFLLQGLRSAGYVIGRGDAEQTEADVPFVRSGQNGAIRLSGQSPCETLWLVALAPAGSTATSVIPYHSPAAGSQPLSSAAPFGFGTTTTPSYPFGSSTP